MKKCWKSKKKTFLEYYWVEIHFVSSHKVQEIILLSSCIIFELNQSWKLKNRQKPQYANEVFSKNSANWCFIATNDWKYIQNWKKKWIVISSVTFQWIFKFWTKSEKTSFAYCGFCLFFSFQLLFNSKMIQDVNNMISCTLWLETKCISTQ